VYSKSSAYLIRLNSSLLSYDMLVDLLHMSFILFVLCGNICSGHAMLVSVYGSANCAKIHCLNPDITSQQKDHIP
jgi:hypothetical protein